MAGRAQACYMAPKGQGIPYQQEAYRTAVPPDGTVGHWPEPQYLETGQGRAAQDIQISSEEPRYRALRAGVGDRYHLYPRKGRLPVPVRDNRPVQPLRGRLVALQHHDIGMVQEDTGHGHRRTRRAGDTQHRPGEPVHLAGVHRIRDQGKADPAQYGRKGQGARQHIRRTPLAQRQIRARIPVPGRRRAGMLPGA